jgi:hypothetical protein
MTDDDFQPRPVPPLRAAVPVRTQQEIVNDAVAELAARQSYDQQTPERLAEQPDAARSQRAKEGWKKRRTGKSPLLAAPYGDRHTVGDHPFDPALAELYRERDALDQAIKVLEDRKGKP